MMLRSTHLWKWIILGSEGSLGNPTLQLGEALRTELRAEWTLDDSRIQFGGWDVSWRTCGSQGGGILCHKKSGLQRQCLCFPASSSHLGILIKQFGVINPSLHTLNSAPSKFFRPFPAHGTAQAPSAFGSGVIFTPSRISVKSWHCHSLVGFRAA